MARDTILVVDDEQKNIEIIKSVLDTFKNYKVVGLNSGKKSVEYLTSNYRSIAIIILDYEMPVVDGLTVLKVFDKKGITKIIPVVMMPSERSEGTMAMCYENGAADIIRKPIIPAVLRGRVKNLIELYDVKANLQSKLNIQNNKLSEQSAEIRIFNEKLLNSLAKLVECRNLETDDHINRVKRLSRVIGEMVCKLFPNEYNLTMEDVALIESAAVIHDIGKIQVHDSILLKPGKLDKEEVEAMKAHCLLGCEMLEKLEGIIDMNHMEVIHNIVHYHHERYDGRGYPEGLKGEEIPIEAQIVALADAYDAMVNDQIYRDAYEKDVAYTLIMDGECGVFSPNMLTCFSKAKPLLEKIEG